MIIVVTFMFIFSIIGVNLLKGKSHYCNHDSLIISDYDKETLIRTRSDCQNYGGEWTLRPDNYDNI